MKHIHEVIEYEHKGIKVFVKINHLKNTVSLVYIQDNTFDGVEDKRWLFADRGLEYMKGWQNILDAMKYAVGEATKILEKDLAESSRFTEEGIIELGKKKKS